MNKDRTILVNIYQLNSVKFETVNISQIEKVTIITEKSNENGNDVI